MWAIVLWNFRWTLLNIFKGQPECSIAGFPFLLCINYDISVCYSS